MVVAETCHTIKATSLYALQQTHGRDVPQIHKITKALYKMSWWRVSHSPAIHPEAALPIYPSLTLNPAIRALGEQNEVPVIVNFGIVLSL